MKIKNKTCYGLKFEFYECFKNYMSIQLNTILLELI